MSLRTQTDSYLTFNIEKELFAINVGRVLEILEIQPITRVPQSPSFMRGVINLRGNILPVVDTRMRFSLPGSDFTIDTCIVVLSIENNKEATLLGVIVDAVQKVIEIKADQIYRSTSISSHFKEEYIAGIAKVDEEFIMVLDVDKVFSTEDLLSNSQEN
ncbi:chemotaxis protein CheW [Desertivirga arenae]|uniref:chemotaxis protein CheW n=1 Tax=Desertivirga arenae TaxID=2810309 RepID=UPI001A964283|nr:chemotaxis protein CheW [Pedobacter sp. SYSU D00823]